MRRSFVILFQLLAVVLIGNIGTFTKLLFTCVGNIRKEFPFNIFTYWLFNIKRIYHTKKEEISLSVGIKQMNIYKFTYFLYRMRSNQKGVYQEMKQSLKIFLWMRHKSIWDVPTIVLSDHRREKNRCFNMCCCFNMFKIDVCSLFLYNCL